jgi:hypothetical protein
MVAPHLPRHKLGIALFVAWVRSRFSEPAGDRSKTLIDIVTAGIQALTDGTVVLPRPGSVKQPSDSEIRAMVEAAIEEKFAQQTAQIPVQIPPNIPTRTEFHELKERVNDFRLSLLREIQNRDKGISLLAEQIAQLTARLDTMPVPGVDKEILETAKGTVLKNWRTTRYRKAVAKGIASGLFHSKMSHCVILT